MIELMIVIAVMGILLTLGVASFQGSQIGSRDHERTADIESLAMYLESFYASGSDSINTTGEYPSIQPISGLIGNEIGYFRDLDTKTIIAPGQTTSSLVVATNNTQTTAGVLPQPTINQYIYQPIATDGSLCDDGAKECRKFNLYYRNESDNTVQIFKSKNQ